MDPDRKASLGAVFYFRSEEAQTDKFYLAINLDNPAMVYLLFIGNLQEKLSSNQLKNYNQMAGLYK